MSFHFYRICYICLYLKKKKKSRKIYCSINLDFSGGKSRWCRRSLKNKNLRVSYKTLGVHGLNTSVKKCFACAWCFFSFTGGRLLNLKVRDLLYTAFYCFNNVFCLMREACTNFKNTETAIWWTHAYRDNSWSTNIYRLFNFFGQSLTKLSPPKAFNTVRKQKTSRCSCSCYIAYIVHFDCSFYRGNYRSRWDCFGEKVYIVLCRSREICCVLKTTQSDASAIYWKLTA